MTSLVISPLAERDLEDVWLSVASHNEPAASKLVRQIGGKIARLQRFPRLGVRRPDIKKSFRMLVQGNYLVLYETQPDTDEDAVDVVEVVRIVDGRRNLRHLLSETR